MNDFVVLRCTKVHVFLLNVITVDRNVPRGVVPRVVGDRADCLPPPHVELREGAQAEADRSDARIGARLPIG